MKQIPLINGKITLNASIDLTDNVYVEVIAQAQKDNNTEYISYEGVIYIISEPEPEEKAEEKTEEEKEGEVEDQEEKEEEEEHNKMNNQTISKNKETMYIIIISSMGFSVFILLLLIVMHFIRKRNLVNKIEMNKNEALLPEQHTK